MEIAVILKFIPEAISADHPINPAGIKDTNPIFDWRHIAAVPNPFPKVNAFLSPTYAVNIRDSFPAKAPQNMPDRLAMSAFFTPFISPPATKTRPC